MNTATLDRECFQQNDIPTQLNYLAAHLDQMRSLVLTGTDSDRVVSLMRESRYYIEWTVLQFVNIDLDASAELVDFGRVLTRWLFDWEKIWVNPQERNEIARIVVSFLERIRSYF